MPISFSCPECAKKLRVADDKQGRKIKCPGCQAVVTVADEDEKSLAEAEPIRRTKGSKSGKSKRGKVRGGSNRSTLLWTAITGAVVVTVGSLIWYVAPRGNSPGDIAIPKNTPAGNPSIAGAGSPASGPLPNAIVLQELPTVVPESHIEFQMTPDYEVAFPGTWRHKQGYPQITARFELASLESASTRRNAGLKALGKNDIQIEDLSPTKSGLHRRLFKHEERQLVGPKLSKWTLLLGKDNWTAELHGDIPAEAPLQDAQTLRAILLSADQIKGGGPPLDSCGGYHLAESKQLKLAQIISGVVDYLVTGEMVSKKANQPHLRFMALIYGELNNDSNPVIKYMHAMSKIDAIEITSRHDIEISGMSGIETEASAIDKPTGTKLVVYQLLLFRKGPSITSSPLVIRGTVGEEHPDKATLLSEFRRMAHGLVKE